MSRTQPAWPALFRCLAEHTDYEERLDGLLDTISLPIVALYLAGDPESRFHLTRLRRPVPGTEKPPSGAGFPACLGRHSCLPHKSSTKRRQKWQQ